MRPGAARRELSYGRGGSYDPYGDLEKGRDGKRLRAVEKRSRVFFFFNVIPDGRVFNRHYAFGRS